MTEKATHQPITLKRNRSYRTYQLHANIAGSGPGLSSTEAVLVRCVLHVMRWLRLKFQDVGAPEGVLDCDPAQSADVAFSDLFSFDAREVAGYQLEVIADDTRKLWAMRLREPDLGAPGRPGTVNYKKFEALPGRIYETNIGLAIKDSSVELGVSVVVSEPDASEKKGAGFRLAVIGNLVEDEDLVLTDGPNPIVKRALQCTTKQSIETLVAWLVNDERQVPVILLCPDAQSDATEPDILANELFSYCQVFMVPAASLPLLSEAGVEAQLQDIMLFYARGGRAASVEGDQAVEQEAFSGVSPNVKLQGYPSELIFSLIVEQVRFYSTGKCYDFGIVKHIADFQREHFQELDAARLRKWAELDKANQRIAKLEEQKEALEEQKDVAQHELERIRELLETAQAEALTRQDDLHIISKAVDHAGATIRQNTGEQASQKRFPTRTKILFIGGGSKLRDKDLQGILKSFGFAHPSESYEWIKYDDVKTFNFQSLIATTRYSDIILGTSPHKCTGMGKYDSPAAFLRNEEDLPRVSILHHGSTLDNFSKSNIRPLIEKSVALEQARQLH